MKILPVVNVSTTGGFTKSKDRHEYDISGGVMILQSPVNVGVEERARAREAATPDGHWTAGRGALRVRDGFFVEQYNVYARPKG